ncbi:MAG: ATP-binding cassette domain-containing protein [Leptospiraceae bacterium]|nr:ATP-binding cassette domain-containing protein [Leptospiraceae bacterium]
MISVQNITLRYGQRALFEEVNLKFTPGNCYGIIGANGAGKSTFLKILSGEEDNHLGEVILPSDQRLAVLKQDHYAYNEYPVLKTVIMGYKRLYEIMEERDAIYAKSDFSDEDGVRASELEEEFSEMGGWEAEAEAASMLEGLGISQELHAKLVKDLNDTEKVRVLLAQALFGNPDVLLLDEPTNHLDVSSVMWLEDFLLDFKNTVIVVSHDRHFLNTVCTHIVDIDFGKMQMYVGNYDFWQQSSELALKQRKDDNRKKEDKIKELKEFIQRFSSNASKARQATSRKKLLDKIKPEEIRPSSRKYPYINFKPEREAGNDILFVENLSKTVDGELLFKDVSFHLKADDKVAVIGDNSNAITMLFKILMGEEQPDSGEVRWGVTITTAYFPKEHDAYFQSKLNLVDWLRQYSEEKEEGFIRGFLGRMLFSGEEALKECNVLSGGEKVRCMLSRMMLSGANVLLFDEPTNHLDLESITSLNNGMIDFPGALLFTSHDHQLTQTVANRVIEIGPDGMADRMMRYDDYLEEKQRNAAEAPVK